MGTGLVVGLKKRLAAWLSSSVADEIGLNDLRRQIAELETQLAASRSDVSSAQVAEPAAPDFSGSAILHPTAVIGPEGVIDNLRGDPKHIRVGEHCYVRGRLLTYGHAGEISIGDWCYIGVRTEIWSMSSVSIGNRVLVSHGVNIIDGSSHSSVAAERHQHFRDILTRGHPKNADEVPGVDGAPIVIEDDAWISFGATILKGVRIGKGSIVAAGAIVTKDVPPGMLYRSKVEPVMTPLAAVEARQDPARC
ncbi:MAG: acyltransferase [Candidatus Obscuribacterales bacterium]